MRIVVAPEAARDLRDAFEFIAKDSVAAADQLLIRMTQTFGLLASNPAVGRDVKLKDGRRVRGWLLRPYRIYYRTRHDSLQILRVYHQARRPIEE